MARKSAALLKRPMALPKASQRHMAGLDRVVPPEGVDAEYDRFKNASYALEEQWVRVEKLGKIVEKDGRDDPNWPAFQDAIKTLAARERQVFSSWDGFAHKVRHRLDPVPVPEADIRAIAIDSLSDKLDQLQFNLNIGLLGSHVTTAIRNLASEGEPITPPLCEDCR